MKIGILRSTIRFSVALGTKPILDCNLNDPLCTWIAHDQIGMGSGFRFLFHLVKSFRSQAHVIYNQAVNENHGLINSSVFNSVQVIPLTLLVSCGILK